MYMCGIEDASAKRGEPARWMFNSAPALRDGCLNNKWFVFKTTPFKI